MSSPIRKFIIQISNNIENHNTTLLSIGLNIKHIRPLTEQTIVYTSFLHIFIVTIKNDHLNCIKILRSKILYLKICVFILPFYINL